MHGNRKFLAGAIAGVATCALVFLCSAWNTLPNDDTFIPGPATFGKDVRVTDGSLYLSGTQVTANATTINAAGGGTTATLAPTLISNATLKVYGSNLVVVTGGTITLPSASIASAALPATIADSTIVSNATLKVYAQTIVVPAGGTLTLNSAVFKAAISNLFTVQSINGTNFYMLAYP
jgi:hypothetical protein